MPIIVHLGIPSSPPIQLTIDLPIDDINIHSNQIYNSNIYAMWIRSKIGSLKPKAYNHKLHETSILQKPSTYKEAIKHIVWLQSMKEEYQALMRNNIRELVDLPYGTSVIGNR